MELELGVGVEEEEAGLELIDGLELELETELEAGFELAELSEEESLEEEATESEVLLGLSDWVLLLFSLLSAKLEALLVTKEKVQDERSPNIMKEVTRSFFFIV